MISLADAIIQEDLVTINQLLRHGGAEVNDIDEYGFTPLIEATIVDNVEIAKLLLNGGANPNMADEIGGTALQWAVENNNIGMCKLLCSYGANPNAYNVAGQPVIAMAILRQQKPLVKYLIKQGADRTFAQDYINTKLLGHIFELIGTANIVSPEHQFVEVDFEGFFLEVTLGLIADSLTQFQNHFAARQLRRYAGLAQFIVEILERATQLAKYQQYRTDIRQFDTTINKLIREDPLIIPVGYEGHAITFIRYADMWVKCDRREDSRLYDNVVFYRMGQPEKLTAHFIKNIIYAKQDSDFINYELDHILKLEVITELKVEAQISGNCSWANVEATIPALFFLVLMKLDRDPQPQTHYKSLALHFFHRWREWNKDRALDLCIQSYEESDSIRKATKAEILAAILFQHQSGDVNDTRRMERILNILLNSPYTYILDNYVRIYYYERPTPEGKRFADLLKQYGYLK